MKGSRPKAAVLLASAFVAGVLTGAGGMAMADRRAPEGPRGPDYYLDRLTRRLDLSPRQRDSVRVVLDRHSPAMEAIWAEVQPRMQPLRAEMRTEIRRLLSAEQVALYETMLAADDAARERRRAAATPDTTPRPDATR